MRRTNSMADIPLPITYTPTTHRISKAKKGKRVHACEFPGCNKVFTRAEHRRRHELNHNPEASFRCTYEGCRKAFHRSDLLTRHMERHELEGQSDSSTSRTWRQQSKSSITSAPNSLVNPLSVEGTSGPYSSSACSTPLSTSSSMFGSAIQPDIASELSLSWNGMEIPLQPRATVFPNHMRDTPDELSFYSSPDTCASPASDTTGFGYAGPSSAPTSLMQSYASDLFTPDLVASPLSLPASSSDWDPLEVPPSIMPLSLDGSGLMQPVEPPMPIPLSNLDGDEWFALRRQLTSAPGVVSGNDGMEIVDTIKWQDCFEYYWQNFHPVFPIVHRPTFFATKPSPLMAGAMVAIGSQYDIRPNAKEYSLALLEACVKLLAKRPPITSRSRVVDIQTVFLLEFLSKFRSRRADVQISHRFRSLYGSFMQDRHWAAQNPVAVLNTLPAQPSPDAVKKAHRFWVEHETRRRVLQAAFVLDIQQSTLFGQPPVLLQPNPNRSGRESHGSRTTDIPFPCSSELWESRHLEDWLVIARSYSPCSLSHVAASLSENMTRIQINEIDPFQSHLLLAYGLSDRSKTGDTQTSLARFASLLENVNTSRGSQETTTSSSLLKPSQRSHSHSRTLFSLHSLLAARYTPIHALLTVSGESWLFNRKLSQEEDFRSAKDKLRQWVSDTDDVKKAVWHASRALQHVAFESGHPAAQRPSSCSSPTASTLPSPIAHTTTTPEALKMLQTNWSLYISVLICWAYGFETGLQTNTSSILSSHSYSTSAALLQSVQQYLQSMISLTPTWKHVSRSTIPVTVRSNTRPLLSYIRMTTLREGRMGGLLNEGERVLARLSETQLSRDGGVRGMWHF